MGYKSNNKTNISFTKEEFDNFDKGDLTLSLGFAKKTGLGTTLTYSNDNFIKKNHNFVMELHMNNDILNLSSNSYITTYVTDKINLGFGINTFLSYGNKDWWGFPLLIMDPWSGDGIYMIYPYY